MSKDDLGGTAAVSVVVSSFSGEGALERCLRSLEAGAPAAEWVVATNASPAAVARLAARFPAARFFRFAADTPGVRLRSLGLVQARGRLIALIEDHCTVSAEWLGTLCAAHRAGYGAVGGPIDNGLDRSLYDWALYLCEYSAYMPPLPEGPARALLGANVSYTREALRSCSTVWQDAFYENEVHDALRAGGNRLYLAAKACVFSHLAMSLREAMAHLFAGGRRFGSYRKSQSRPAARFCWVLAAPAVPVVLLGRIIGRVLTRRPRHLATLLRGMPYILGLLAAWSAGEASGYLIRSRKAARNTPTPRTEPSLLIQSIREREESLHGDSKDKTLGPARACRP
jgi:hypothetical protein